MTQTPIWTGNNFLSLHLKHWEIISRDKEPNSSVPTYCYWKLKLMEAVQ
jgi:hypothetical protein